MENAWILARPTSNLRSTPETHTWQSLSITTVTAAPSSMWPTPLCAARQVESVGGGSPDMPDRAGVDQVAVQVPPTQQTFHLVG